MNNLFSTMNNPLSGMQGMLAQVQQLKKQFNNRNPQDIQGKSPDEIWPIMDELMQAILITNPRLYDGVMRRINGQV